MVYAKTSYFRGFRNHHDTISFSTVTNQYICTEWNRNIRLYLILHYETILQIFMFISTGQDNFVSWHLVFKKCTDSIKDWFVENQTMGYLICGLHMPWPWPRVCSRSSVYNMFVLILLYIHITVLRKHKNSVQYVRIKFVSMETYTSMSKTAWYF